MNAKVESTTRVSPMQALKKHTHMTSTSHINIYIRKKVPKVGRLFFF